MMKNINRRQFLNCTFRAGVGGVLLGLLEAEGGSLISNSSMEVRLGTQPSNPFPQLNKVADRFTFTVVADPQLGGPTNFGSVPGTSAVRYEDMIMEMNEWPRRPAFMVVNGDLVNTPTNDDSWINFMDRTSAFKNLSILIYGNHDGNRDTNHFERFLNKQEELNGTRGHTFSWDCGQWHFITIPWLIIAQDQLEQEILVWLENDLRLNRNKPCIFFSHVHLMPQGLSQLEWYTYRREFRMEVLDLLAKYGNVKYAVCGHVHNGIKASYKMTWTYRGIHFITGPTCTASRQFGEEYEEFSAGLDNEDGHDFGGGYYMLFEIDGRDATVKARLANHTEEFTYPTPFRPYNDQEPLWFKTIHDHTLTSSLVNGDFANDQDGWKMPYRYIAEEDPMFYWSFDPDIKHTGNKSAYLQVREKSRPWAQTELLELYQIVQSPPSPVLNLNYRLDDSCVGGGGYVRIFAYDGIKMRKMFFADWGASPAEKHQAINIVRNSLYTGTDERRIRHYFKTMGSNKEGLFWTLPDDVSVWHTLKLNLKQLCEDSGAGNWFELGVNKLLITIGVWSLETIGSISNTRFDDVRLRNASGGDISAINGATLAVDGSVFTTDFGSE